MNFAIVTAQFIWNDGKMLILLFAAIAAPSVPTITQYQVINLPKPEIQAAAPKSDVPEVPFYSQFKDITSPKWQKVGCGVTSLAMVVDYYKPAVSVNKLLEQGIAGGAYLQNAGWTYKGLIQISQKYGLDGVSYDLGKKSADAAFTQFKNDLKGGPVIASVHYKFDPKSTIPHLVVINGIKDGVLTYNDPAAKTGAKQISTADFLKAWKKRYIVVRPTDKGGTIALTKTI